jgi:hypothetical protein
LEEANEMPVKAKLGDLDPEVCEGAYDSGGGALRSIDLEVYYTPSIHLPAIPPGGGCVRRGWQLMLGRIEAVLVAFVVVVCPFSGMVKPCPQVPE